MPKVDIFVDSVLQETLMFQSYFMILNVHDNLCWKFDEELQQGGGVLVWARREFDGYKIVFVLSSWVLTIGKVAYPSQPYQDIRIGDQPIKLSYRNYDFVFFEQITADTG